MPCFVVAFLFAAFITAVMEGWITWEYILIFFAGAPEPVGANCVGFIAGFLIFRPYAHEHKWRPYLVAAAAGALAFLLDFVVGVKVKIRYSELVLPTDFCSGLIATCVLFGSYRVAVDRGMLRK